VGAIFKDAVKMTVTNEAGLAEAAIKQRLG
jgi:hypothetical protein